MVHYTGFANVQNGAGMIVTALASIILGEALFSQRTIRRRLLAALMGAVAFRLMVAAVLRMGFDPNALKLFGALRAAGAAAAALVPAVPEGAWIARQWRCAAWPRLQPGHAYETAALQNVNLVLEPSAFVVVLGSNGSKSTLLNAIAGSLMA
ncbi:MAG: hypothetical protein IPK12_14155, partial [Gemmatimonadetes bacterium]|nr:hypothetical protein [Gemmatimonadota bacterium]